MTRFKTLIVAGGLLTAFGGISAANAATYTFDFSKGTNLTYSSKTFQDTSGAMSVTATAGAISTSCSGSKACSASLGWYDTGLGVVNGPRDDYHTIDNSGLADFVSFDFTQDVKIDKIVFEIFSKDGDFTYNLGDSWSTGQVNVSTNPGKNGSTTVALTTTTFDDVWRVFASLKNPDSTIDSFKITKLEVSSVPLPAAVWLFGSAMLGMFGIGYRRQAASV